MNVRFNPEIPATVEETLALICECTWTLPSEAVGLAESRGCTLRETVVAAEDQPGFDRSAVDGYAVRVDETNLRLRVVDRLRAGDWRPRELGPGEAVQIATGAALPGGGLRVVMKEDCEDEGDWVVAKGGGGNHIRRRGEDASAGDVLVAEGTVLGPGALALLASLGHTRPAVTRRPEVLHVATGLELVPPEERPGPGQIRDSNSTLVRAFLGQWGCRLRQCRVGEDRDEFLAVLTEDEAKHGPVDLLLVSGGASVGEHDVTRSVLERRGYDIRVAKTTTRPGKPLIFAAGANGVAFGLPGNPLSHFVCLNLYVRQALVALNGLPGRVRFSDGRLSADLEAGGNPRETLWPARAERAGDGTEVAPLAWRSSGDLTALARANALVWLRPGTGGLRAGAAVRYLRTSAPE